MLSGLLHPTSGQIEVAGHNPHKRENKFLQKISLVMGQKNQLFWDLPAIETFELNRRIYSIPTIEYQKNLHNLTELLDAKEIIHQQVRELSLGQRMKCELIASLLHKPEVLFLDEPTIGLDVMMQNNLRNFVRAFNQEFGATIILTSHYMRDVQELCKRVIIINHGSIVYQGNLADVVKKHTNIKQVKLSFLNEVTKSDISRYGKILSFAPLQVIFEAERKDISHLTEQLLKNFSVEDLEVSETPIEEVIQQVFTSHTI